jgi:hypothetical protein
MPIWSYFLVIGHAFFALIFAVAGGVIGRYIYAANNRIPKDVADAPSNMSGSSPPTRDGGSAESPLGRTEPKLPIE